MSGMQLFLTVFGVLGGLAVFVLGMGMMTEGLRRFSGQSLRRVLAAATRSRVAGIGLGTLLGFLVHSSAATVMYVGFINAGLMGLAESIPPILGANIGTTFSMQLISFKLGDYCYVFIALGLGLKMAVPQPKAKHLGAVLLGFGLLFLGMNTMGAAVGPHKDSLTPLLTYVDGGTLGGMLAGIGASALFTGLVQSSGATIGMCFVLIRAGVIQTQAFRRGIDCYKSSTPWVPLGGPLSGFGPRPAEISLRLGCSPVFWFMLTPAAGLFLKRSRKPAETRTIFGICARAMHLRLGSFAAFAGFMPQR